jgi:hypothetical protein
MMGDSGYRYGYKVGPFYRKFMAGDNVWCEVIKFSEMWMRESPYYDPADPIIIEQVFVDWDNFKTTKKIIKEMNFLKPNTED